MSPTRRWLVEAGKRSEVIPPSISKLEFSKSQKHNRKGSDKLKPPVKANLTAPLSAIAKHVPAEVTEEARSSPAFDPDTDAIKIHCDENNGKGRNAETCFEELGKILKKAASDVVKRGMSLNSHSTNATSQYVPYLPSSLNIQSVL